MRRIIILFFILSPGIMFSEETDSPTFWYNLSLLDLNVNQAEQIVMGSIEKYSDKYPLSPISLGRLNKDTLRILRNTIYARHGYIFRSDDLSNYFSKFDWYNPRATEVEQEFTEADSHNLEMIQEFETMDESIKDIEISDDIVGVWQWGYGMASGWSDRFVFYSRTEMEFLFSQMSQLQMIVGLKGKYYVDGNVLIFNVNSVDFVDHSSDFNFSGGWGFEWKKEKINTASFKNPIIFKFPVSKINIAGEYGAPEIMIGGDYFYRMERDPNNRF